MPSAYSVKIRWERGCSFPAPLFCFMLFTLCEMHSEIVLLSFFGGLGIVPIFVADNTRAVWTRSLFATKIFSERHVPQSENMVRDIFTKNKSEDSYRIKFSSNLIYRNTWLGNIKFWLLSKYFEHKVTWI